jgi:hypothetical protein
MFSVWQFCFRRASLSRFIHRFLSNQGQTHCFDFVCQLSPICNSLVDTPMNISSFIFAVNTSYQHDKLFTRRQIQIVLILFQSHCISCSRWIEHQWCKSHTFGINFHMIVIVTGQVICTTDVHFNVNILYRVFSKLRRSF